MRSFFVGGDILISAIKGIISSVKFLLEITFGIIPEIWIEEYSSAARVDKSYEWNCFLPSLIQLESDQMHHDQLNDQDVPYNLENFDSGKLSTYATEISLNSVLFHGTSNLRQIISETPVKKFLNEKEAVLFMAKEDSNDIRLLTEQCHCILRGISSKCNLPSLSFFSFTYTMQDESNYPIIQTIMGNIILPQSCVPSRVKKIDYKIKGILSLYGVLNHLVKAILHKPKASSNGWIVHVWLRNEIDPNARNLLMNQLLEGCSFAKYNIV